MNFINAHFISEIQTKITDIGNFAFKGCSSLVQISIPYILDAKKMGLGSQVQILRIK